MAWAAAWPAWRVVTMPAVLAILIRVGIELAIGLFARPHATLIRLVIQFLLGMLASPTASVGAIPNSGGLLDEIERYRQDPRTRETLVALERLLTGADVPSVPARVGLAVAYTEDASVDVAIDPNDEGFVVGGLRFKFVSKNQSKSKGGDS